MRVHPPSATLSRAAEGKQVVPEQDQVPILKFVLLKTDYPEERESMGNGVLLFLEPPAAAEFRNNSREPSNRPHLQGKGFLVAGFENRTCIPCTRVLG
jgi:hypothetical protein